MNPDLPQPELRAAACEALGATEPRAKCTAVLALSRARCECALAVSAHIAAPDTPGRPSHPELVHPSRVPRRRLTTPAGRVALLHAVAHIEFNAINLALDAIARFPDLPEAYYWDWLGVAEEEARHFMLLETRLASCNSHYGALPAHDGLWEAAMKTRHDPLLRMALVPRVLEARGLDVTPALQARLRAVGDEASADVLSVILRDEVGHVAVGDRWYRYLCAQRGWEPEQTFLQLCQRDGARPPQPPFNLAARTEAGFSREELAGLEALALSTPRT